MNGKYPVPVIGKTYDAIFTGGRKCKATCLINDPALVGEESGDDRQYAYLFKFHSFGDPGGHGYEYYLYQDWSWNEVRVFHPTRPPCNVKTAKKKTAGNYKLLRVM